MSSYLNADWVWYFVAGNHLEVIISSRVCLMHWRSTTVRVLWLDLLVSECFKHCCCSMKLLMLDVNQSARTVKLHCTGAWGLCKKFKKEGVFCSDPFTCCTLDQTHTCCAYRNSPRNHTVQLGSNWSLVNHHPTHKLMWWTCAGLLKRNRWIWRIICSDICGDNQWDSHQLS